MTQETMEFDIVIVGAGPSGLAAAIRLGQLNQQQQSNLKIGVLEKGSEVGSDIISGAVMDPTALTELLPNWQQLQAPLFTTTQQDRLLFLTKKHAFSLPVPNLMRNKNNNYIISLSELSRWLAQQAQALGIEIFAGFAAAELNYDSSGKIIGVITGDFGLDKNNQPTERYQPGVIINCKQVLLAEGCRGSLTKKIIEKFQLAQNKSPQTYSLGVKELWEIDPALHQSGLVLHSLGWPLNHKTYGGSFLYHWHKNYVSVGFVVGLDYQNPYLDPFEELQRFKTHPAIKTVFKNGKRISYGARALVEGGWQALPKLTFPNGMLIGDCAGFLNVPKIKGIHNAIRSGILAAQTIFAELKNGLARELTSYETAIINSNIAKELKQVRNIRPGFHYGLMPGLAYAALDHYILRGKSPWNFKNNCDHLTLKPAKACKKINYPKPDNELTFDKLSSVFIANTHYRENQPCHLQLQNPAVAIDINYDIYASPESRYCPANVYEIIQQDQQPKLQINTSNCVQCKSCDIKDPTQNINWVTPEGGDGPEYREL